MICNSIRFLILTIILTIHITCDTQIKRCDLDILRGTKNIKQVKANFDLKNKLVFYQVKFCKDEWMCFATKIKRKLKQEIQNNKAKQVGLWTKLINTMMGYNNVVPYNPTQHEYVYGSFYDQRCHGKYYIINETTNHVNKRNISNEACLNDDRSCGRACLRSINGKNKCHEVRLSCIFKKQCKES